MFTIEYVAPSELNPASYNPRLMTEEARSRLRRSVSEFGMVDPIIARRGDRLVVGGHQRLVVALELGLATVPVVYVDDLDDQRAAALNVALNNPAEQGAWDMPKLSELLSSLDASGFDTTLTGFDAEELAVLLAPIAGGLLPGADPDDVPALRAVPVTRAGDVITLGTHQLVCGDATDAGAWDALLRTEQADCIWTDPPYGVDVASRNASLNRVDGLRPSDRGARNETPIEGDDLPAEGLRALLHAALSLAWTRCRAGASWYVSAPSGQTSFEFATVLRDLAVWRHTLVWAKDTFVMGRSDYQHRHESIFYGWKEGASHTWRGGRSQDSVLEFPRPRASPEHPTMKPVALVQLCIENSSDEKAIVADPFGGSGSTLLACEAANRRARLIELSPAYCDVIVERWERSTGNQAVRHGRA